MTEATDPPIKIWQFDGAPPEYKAMSGHGGDEDWVIYSPPGLDPDVAESIAENLKRWDFSRYTLEDGSTIWITAHASLGVEA